METEYTGGLVEKAIAYVKGFFTGRPSLDSEGMPVVATTENMFATDVPGNFNYISVPQTHSDIDLR